ncbi:MBL fold metallo-hydrolase [Phenylobacterium sp.]|uniref:MBL fold metallo-hydrolase n=1 Tax=Phenylobacterium sp. TaxID=1871053 RepID=UPI0027317635|nr:MBL fold metallo-hydrolase [Phenylobacterium sp.]MDP1615932.1 MBL fold metallo-hydrolase [Phenylobacterium sp.]MDP1988713.1 MBL fold metallo-hydrolase [Phenylobacterium sp.]
MKRSLAITLISLLLLVAVGGGLWLARGQLALALMDRVMARNLAADPFADLPDGLHVALCGAGSPMPDATRAGPCTAVIAGRRLFVVDAGTGASRNLTLMNLPPARIEAVLLSHFHSDHIDGLGELLLQRWAGGSAAAPTPVYGPPGVETVLAGFAQAYSLDRGYRVAHHGPQVTPPAGYGASAHMFQLPEGGTGLVILDEPDLKITTFRVDHDPVEPAVGYRFDYKGRSAVLSGDTTPSAAVEAQARGADLLVHEALSIDLVNRQRAAAEAAGRTNLAQIFADITDYHTTPEQAAQLARRAGVKFLLLNHIVPPLPIRALEGPFLGEARSQFSGPLKVGRDGDLISLPTGSDEVRAGRRMSAQR